MDAERRRHPKRLDDVIERNTETGAIAPRRAPVLLYLLNVQEEGTSLLAVSVSQGVDEFSHGIALPFEIVQQVKRDASSGRYTKAVTGLTKIYSQHIITITETPGVYDLEETDDE